MSDNADETIDAGPDALQAIHDQAAKLRAEQVENQVPGRQPVDPPLRVWRVDDTDAAADAVGDAETGVDLTVDLAAADAVGDAETGVDLTVDLAAADAVGDAEAGVDLTVDLAAADAVGDAETGVDLTVDLAAADAVGDAEAGVDLTTDVAEAGVGPYEATVPFASDGAHPEALQDVVDANAPVDIDADDGVPADSDAARDFVRESRERSKAAGADDAASEPTKRRSGAWVVLAMILGAQILAAGVYVALTTLGTDDEQSPDLDEVVLGPETGGDEQTSAAPTAVATSQAAPIPPGTPTPVPPTPTWRPVSGGPRSAPFTFVLEAIVNAPGMYNGRDGDPVDIELDGRAIPLMNPLASGAPLVLRVVGGEPGDAWAQVELPGDGTIVWVRTDDFVWESTTVLVQVDLASNSLQIFDGNEAVYVASIASGTRDRPTPQLSTYVAEDLPSTNDAVPGRIRLASFGGRSALSDGLSAFALESTTDTAAFTTEAGYSTDGRILLTPNDFREVSRLISAGAKVEIVGVPAAPTPTPLPQVPSGSGDGSEGGFFGCPPATRGSPPNCYRVVERLTVDDECSGRQVLIEDDCYLLGGNPELDAFGRNCPANSPDEFGGLCYLRVGPVPQLPGPCPEGAVEVANECREPA